MNYSVEKNFRMVNSVAVAVVFIQGPDQRGISTDEMHYAYAQSLEGARVLTELEPFANLSWHWHYDQVFLDYEPFATSPWPGMPDDFYTGIDAAVGHQGFLYFFKGNQFVLYDLDQNRVMPGYPKETQTSWLGLTPEFVDGIDAAVRDHQEAVYLFKDDMVARFSVGESTVDAGYPKPIADEWRVPDYFECDLDAALWRADLQRILLIKGKQYTQFSTVGPNINVFHHDLEDLTPGLDTAVTKRIKEPFGQGIDAAVSDNEGRIYFFKNERYEGGFLRISDIEVGVDPGYPDEIAMQGGEMEEVWLYPTMQALGSQGSDEGLAQYLDSIREDLGTQWVVGVFVMKYPTMRPGYGKSSKRLVSLRSTEFSDTNIENFRRWFAHEICHVFGAKDEYGSSPCTCTQETDLFFTEVNANCRKCAPDIMEHDYPKDIDEEWNGVQPPFDGEIDAAVQRGNGRIYFFKDDQYIRFMDFDQPASSPLPIHPNWDGLPTDPAFNFRQGIDAAMRHDGRIYFFKNHKMVRFIRVADGADPGYTPDIKDVFTGMPTRFHQDLDAACSGVQDRVYLFKNGEYVRFSTFGEDMDAGYPKDIEEGIEALDGFFHENLQAAFYGVDHRLRYFKDNQLAVVHTGEHCLMLSTSERMCRYTRRQIGWGPFMTHIDAAVMRSNGRIYLFSGDQYIRISDPEKGYDNNYPKPIAGNFPGLPESFQEGIDAALWAKDHKRLYFFKGDEFVRYANVSEGIDLGPMKIRAYWGDLPPSFQSGIDAALWNNHDHKIYFFKGNKYVKVLDLESGWVSDSMSLSDGWPNMDTNFELGINAALMNDKDDRVYFFKSARMLRFNDSLSAVDDGWPKFINRCWMPFPELDDSF